MQHFFVYESFAVSLIKLKGKGEVNERDRVVYSRTRYW